MASTSSIVIRLILSPFSPAILFNVVSFLLFYMSARQGRGPDMVVVLIGSYSSFILAIAGIEADARRRRITPCFDFGYFFGMFFPISALWWCVRTHGWSGLLLLGFLLGLWMAPSFCAVFATALAGQPLDRLDR